MGYYKLSEKETRYFEIFFSAARIIKIDYEIIHQATGLRKIKMMKLGDALIAATAIRYGLKLVTHNTVDFKHIKHLQLIDPITIKNK